MVVTSPRSPTSTVRLRVTGAAWIAVSALAVALHGYALYRPTAPAQVRWLPHADKLGHLLVFAVPVALVLLTIGWFAGTLTPIATTLVVLAFALSALGSEAVQAIAYPERTGDVADVIADAAGIVLGVLAARLVRR